MSGVSGVSADLDTVLGDWSAAGRVVVAVPDGTRPLDVRPALAALRARVRGELVVVVGLGLHRPMSRAELSPLAPWSPRQSDPDDVVDTIAWDGIPGQVTRSVAGADAVVSVGVLELHQYAGVSGGHKGVAVGCGGRATIAALHARARVLAPGVRLGQVAGNPFRQAIDALGRAAGVTHALNWLPGHGWLFGDPVDVVARGAAALDPWEPVASTFAGAVLHVPPSKASSLYQASRAATYLALSPHPPVRDGGTLVLAAACPEGLGAEAGFRRALADHRPPWSELLTGPPPRGAGAQRAVVLAQLAQRFRLAVAGPRDPAVFAGVGIEVLDAAPTGPGWLQVRTPFTRLPQQAQPDASIR